MVSDKVVSPINCLNDGTASSLVTAYVLGTLRGEHPSEVSLHVLVTTIQQLFAHFALIWRCSVRVSLDYCAGHRWAGWCWRCQFEMIEVLWHGFWKLPPLCSKIDGQGPQQYSTAVVKQCSVDFCWGNFPKDQVTFFPIIFFFPILASQSQLVSLSVMHSAHGSNTQGGQLLLLPIPYMVEWWDWQLIILHNLKHLLGIF